jgi:DNA-binding transcriptional ArsR family regulator
MLALLAKRGRCIAGELAAPFDISQPTASKHLRVLERAGLITRQVDGRIHQFRLLVKPLEEAERWISRHREFWEGSLSRLGGYLDELAREKKRNG